MTDNSRYARLIEGRFVVCAACKYGDLIIAGARHYDLVMQSQLNLLSEKDELKYLNGAEVVEGFIDQYGKFMDRKEAFIVAKEAGQLNVRRRTPDDSEELFSECLY